MERYAPHQQLARLFRKAAALRALWVPKDEAKKAMAPALNLRAITARLRTRTAGYVANVLATVDLERRETVARAVKALEAIPKLRSRLSARRAQRARKEDVVETPAPKPAPTPVVPTPGDDS